MKFLVFLSISLNALAQCDEKGFIANATIGDIGKPEIGSYYLPAYKEVAIYSAPSTKSKASYKTKSFKDSLKVLEILNTQVVLKRVYGYWYKVSFPFNGKRFIGYVPSQFLATNYLNYTNMRYLLLVNKYANNQFVLNLKILKNFQMVGFYAFTPSNSYSYHPIESDTINAAMSGYLDMALFNNKGLDSIDNIIRVTTGIDGCGYWNGSQYLLMKNFKVKAQIEDGGVADGDVYSDGYEITFPDTLGQPNNLLKNYYHWERNEDDTTANTWEAKVKFKWQNFQFIKTDSTYSSTKVNVSDN
jgi:hypothetical protein